MRKIKKAKDTHLILKTLTTKFTPNVIPHL